MYDFNEKLAKLVINYALEVQPGDLVSIEGSDVANELKKVIAIQLIKAGAYPLVVAGIKGLNVAMLKYGSDEQLKFIPPWFKMIIEQFDKRIQISADYNRQKMTEIDPNKQNMIRLNPEFPNLMKKFMERTAKKELKWCIVPFPCDAMAQEAKTDTESYREFVYKALMLDTVDPAEEWKKIEMEQKILVDYLNDVDQIQVLGEDTDLTLSVKGRPWENCCGHENLPDGEVFTSPIESSVNGTIRFTYPGIYQGKEVENIFLEFKDGKVIRGTADKGQELLDAILKIENANVLGEFAVGTNYGITKFTKDMLFDEKLGGTMHLALGMGFPETKSENLQCAIHWDILKDMTSENSKIIADGKVIYEAGKWKI